MDKRLLQQRLNELTSMNMGKQLLWKPKPGEQIIRIVPYQHNRDWPFVELYFYYNLAGRRTTISPVSFKRPDPIKAFADKLMSTGDADDYKMGKALSPKRRTYAPILVRGEEEAGVRFWGFGSQIYQQILETVNDPDYGDITDPIRGRDIKIIYEKSTGPNTFPKTTMRVKPNVSPVTQSEAVLKLLKNMADVTTLWPEPSEDELQDILTQLTTTDGDTTPSQNYSFQNSDDDDDGDDDDGDTTPGASSDNNPISSGGTVTNEDLNAMFKDIINQ